MSTSERDIWVSIRTENTEQCARCELLKKCTDCSTLCKKLPKIADDVDDKRWKLVIEFAQSNVERANSVPCTCDFQRYKGLRDNHLRFLNQFEKIRKGFLDKLLETFRWWPQIDPKVIYGALLSDSGDQSENNTKD